MPDELLPSLFILRRHQPRSSSLHSCLRIYVQETYHAWLNNQRSLLCHSLVRSESGNRDLYLHHAVLFGLLFGVSFYSLFSGRKDSLCTFMIVLQSL